MAKKSYCGAQRIVALFGLPMLDEKGNLHDLRGFSLTSIAG
jgi:hypothetical protein